MTVKKERAAGEAFTLLKLSNPVYAWLELTHECPGSCPGCPSGAAGGESAVLPGTRWAGVIRGLSAFMEEVRLTGGEPTLHPDFFQILDALEAHKLYYRIYTNGLWPQPQKLLKTLKQSRFFRGFFFSLHSSIDSVHQWFTGLTNHALLIHHIRQAVKKGLPVYTATVLGEFNRNDIPAVLKLAATLGSMRQYFLRYIGPAREGVSMSRDALKSIIRSLAQIPLDFFSYRVSECFPGCFCSSSPSCLAGITHITITPSLLVRACPFSADISGKWVNRGRGGITGRKNLEKWVSDIPESCLGCDDIGACLGGCRVTRRNFLVKRDPLMEGPMGRRNTGQQASDKKPLTLQGAPRLRAMVRKETFGSLLISEGEVIPVTDRACELLSLCDGTRGIGEIEEKIAPEAMEFLLSLYLRGFLELETD